MSEFKLSPETREILKNAASINQGIIVYPGNRIATCSPMQQIFTVATVPDTFPEKFAIYDLNRFLAVLSIFEDPEIEFGDESLTVKEGRRTLLYQYAPDNIIVAPPEGKEVKVKDEEVLYSFWLSKDQLQSMFKAAGVMKHPDLLITSKQIATINKKMDANSFKLDLEDVEGGDNTNVTLKIENIKIIPGDYEVRVAARKVEFVSSDEKRTQRYVVMVEAGNAR